MSFRIVLLLCIASTTVCFYIPPARSGRYALPVNRLKLQASIKPTASTKKRSDEVSASLVVESSPGTTRREVFGVSLRGIASHIIAPLSLNIFSASAAVGKMNEPTLSSSSPALVEKTIAYRAVLLPIQDFGVEVPVSIWYPTEKSPTESGTEIRSGVKYSYRISLRRIAQLLAKWEFIPDFIAKKFSLEPSISTTSNVRVVNGSDIPIEASRGAASEGTNLVFFAHGFLGSRLDLAYIAEDLAAQGFVCVSPEYPESLEASYPRLEGLDRVSINEILIPYIQDLIPQQILSYSAIGHSLGCRTVLKMGDDSWNRILMGSGKAPDLPSMSKDEFTPSLGKYQIPAVGGRLLFISSENDGPVTSWGGGIQIPPGYKVLEEQELDLTTLRAKTPGATENNPDRFALVFDREDAPNHISYLSENVNDAMISFLSPLLPVTQALKIPVLDFDKYARSRDSAATGMVLKPLVSNFLSPLPTKVDDKTTT